MRKNDNLSTLCCTNHTFYALGGPGAIRCEGRPAELRSIVQTATRKLADFEQKYSRYLPNSVVSRINAGAGNGKLIKLDQQSCGLLNYAFSCYEQSDGLFDITSGILREVWNFKGTAPPKHEEIQALLPLIGLPQLIWNEPHVALPKAGMEIDFGGFGKEYAADMLAQYCYQAGVEHGLVELAGDIAVIGPPTVGAGWPIGISNPVTPSQPIAEVSLQHGGLATSGTYERFIEHAGKRYSHILNPSTGWPVDSWAGLTVIADSCLLAGTLSTIALLKGKLEGRAWLEQLGVSFLCIADDGSVSGNLAEA
ncbi:MAG: FAD:protein FMN transferase [Pseudomonadales bacterium]